MSQTIIQAVLNEDVRTDAVPGVPILPHQVRQEMAGALGAGASVIHFHGRTPSGGQAPDDTAYYVSALQGLTDLNSLNWYPPQGHGVNGRSRWRFLPDVQRVVGMNLISIDPHLFDMMDVDPGTGAIKPSWMAKLESSESAGEPESPLAQWLWFCAEARRLELKPLFGVFEPGTLRKIVTWWRNGLVDGPVVLNLFLTERFHFGLDPIAESLDRLRAMIPADMPYEWFCCPIGVAADTERRLQQHAVRTGGHLRVGLGSPPIEGFAPEASNASVVRAAVELVRSQGGQVASADDARRILGVARSLDGAAR
ncbi:3-keto-5-aminohexanoate cleavage protein [Jatrophihabitans cynanchi]|uniref:3-keto-5-aminohexanoate cleavage protein n=1 Tax=Jatrophihabitans cynanchi TaxID=2944128 RepID=A0ABY7K2F1_9ACTN|nr:3-keto-5-aminohexanoate cleavage protein [Jatrophihabitans sp. SB3-54]WAX58370.1 3-keto-5-aminohexanoate cleavage protein [Jatrophihabitans sp. SB3-54]